MTEKRIYRTRKWLRLSVRTLSLHQPEQGTDGAIIKAKELVAKYPDKYFMPNQFSNKYNKIAHYKTTAEEIWKQTQRQNNAFCLVNRDIRHNNGRLAKRWKKITRT